MTKTQLQSLYDLAVLAVKEAYEAGIDNQSLPLQRLEAIKRILLPSQVESGPKTEYQRFQSYLEANAPTLLKMREPVSEAQYVKLCELEDKKLLIKVIDNMSNWKPLCTKNISAFKTMINWYNKDNDGKQGTGNKEAGTITDRAKSIIERAIA